MPRPVPVLLALLAPATSLAASTAETSVRQQIAKADEELAREGYQRTHEPLLGSLADDALTQLAVSLEGGRDVMLVGLCDVDCSDLDLKVYGPDGALVDADQQDDDVPMVNIVPRVTGTFRVEVVMAQCSVAPCVYGVGVYAKSALQVIQPLQPTATAPVPAPASADARFVATVEAQMGHAATLLASRGYTPFNDLYVDSLAPRARDDLTFTLVGGRPYAVIGVCDGDCSDLDITVVDAFGNTVASDGATDDTPVVQFTVPSTGTYSLRVTMYACSTNICYYGVRAFQGR